MVRELKGVQCRGQKGLDVPHDKPLEALYDNECVHDRPVVIEAGYIRLLWPRNDGGGLEARWDNAAAHG